MVTALFDLPLHKLYDLIFIYLYISLFATSAADRGKKKVKTLKSAEKITTVHDNDYRQH